MGQYLTPGARARKAKRDLEYAKTPERRKKKAENQVTRRKAKKNGKDLGGLDYDHKDEKFESVLVTHLLLPQGTYLLICIHLGVHLLVTRTIGVMASGLFHQML